MDKETLKKQLLVTIFELLAQQGLLTEEEKNHAKVMIDQANEQYEKGRNI